MPTEECIAQMLIDMERAALERWGRGDPSGFLEISAPEVVYFDPMQPQRLDGWNALATVYESIRGKIHVDRFEMLNPQVQATPDMAVLTFNYVGYVGEMAHRWNCTEVYRLFEGQWRIIQTHWSVTQPGAR